MHPLNFISSFQGHMRTNKECPLYGKQVKKAFPKRSYHRPNTSKSKTIYQLLNSNKLAKTSKVVPANSHSSVDLLNQSRQTLSNEFEYGLAAPETQEDYHESIQVTPLGDWTTDILISFPKDQMMNSIEPAVPSNDEEDSVALKLVIPKQLIQQYSAPTTQLSSDSKNRLKNRRLSKGEILPEKNDIRN